MQCLYVAENLTKCLLTRGVRLWEVCISRGLTVFAFNNIYGHLGRLYCITKRLKVFT